MKKYASNIEGFNLILTNKSFNENKLVKENFSNNNDMSLNFYSPSNSEIFNILSNSIKKMDEPISEFGFFAVSLISHQVKKKKYKSCFNWEWRG